MYSNAAWNDNDNLKGTKAPSGEWWDFGTYKLNGRDSP